MKKPGAMLAKPLEGKPQKGLVLEPKLDGIRLIVHKEAGEVSIYTRTFHEQTGKLPHLEAAFAKIPFDFTLDGEVAAIKAFTDIDGVSVPVVDFSATQSVMGSGAHKAVLNQKANGWLTFIAFDCLVDKGEDITKKPDVSRRQSATRLVEMLEEHTDHIMQAPRWTKWDDSYFSRIVAGGGEGVMLKDPLGTYHPGKRSSVWLKIKDIASADVVITGYKAGNNGFTGMVGAVLFGQYKNGKLVQRTANGEPCGVSGMDMRMRKEFTDNGDSYIGRVMEIKYFGRVGPEQSFRHPNFVCVRIDKNAEDCEWE